jgi:hypothetical protein
LVNDKIGTAAEGGGVLDRVREWYRNVDGLNDSGAKNGKAATRRVQRSDKNKMSRYR